MPAKNEYIVTDNQQNEVLRIEVVEDGLSWWRSVYFMDQSPTFTLRVENIGEEPTEGSTYARMIFDESSKDYEAYTHQEIECTLEPGQSREIEYSLNMLSYQGNAAIRIDMVRARSKDGIVEISSSSNRGFHRIYTCMVYDRDYYRVNYLRPRRAQYAAVGLAVLIVFTGVVQIVSSTTIV